MLSFNFRLWNFREWIWWSLHLQFQTTGVRSESTHRPTLKYIIWWYLVSTISKLCCNFRSTFSAICPNHNWWSRQCDQYIHFHLHKPISIHPNPQKSGVRWRLFGCRVDRSDTILDCSGIHFCAGFWVYSETSQVPPDLSIRRKHFPRSFGSRYLWGKDV